MRLLLAPDSFKGTFSAAEVADALAEGAAAVGASAERCPLADGGEGTLDVLAGALGGRCVEAAAHDPLGRAIRGRFALLGDDGRVALVETASASGLTLVPEAQRDAFAASSSGTGELLVAAAAAGAERILVCAGGSATTDGGAGALEAVRAAGGLGGAKVVVLCDVTTPWERCAELYGPQKGASPQLVARLAQRLEQLAQRLPRDPRGVPMTGAAGGLAGGLWAQLGAELVGGAAHVLDCVGFDERLRRADAVITGEGRLDRQSATGKLVGEVARRAAAAGVAAHAVVGRSELDGEAAARLGLRSVLEASTRAAISAAGAALAGAT